MAEPDANRQDKRWQVQSEHAHHRGRRSSGRNSLDEDGCCAGEWSHEESIRTWTDEWSPAKVIKQLGRRAADICAQRNMLNNAMLERATVDSRESDPPDDNRPTLRDVTRGTSGCGRKCSRVTASIDRMTRRSCRAEEHREQRRMKKHDMEALSGLDYGRALPVMSTQTNDRTRRAGRQKSRVGWGGNPGKRDARGFVVRGGWEDGCRSWEHERTRTRFEGSGGQEE